MHNDSQLKIYEIAGAVAKFRSLCPKHKMDFYPELILFLVPANNNQKNTLRFPTTDDNMSLGNNKWLVILHPLLIIDGAI